MAQVIDPVVTAGNYFALKTRTDEQIIAGYPETHEYVLSMVALVRDADNGTPGMTFDQFKKVISNQLQRYTLQNDARRIEFLQTIVDDTDMLTGQKELFHSPYEIPVHIEEKAIPENALAAEITDIVAINEQLQAQHEKLQEESDKMCAFWQEQVDIVEVRAIYDYFRELCKE